MNITHSKEEHYCSNESGKLMELLQFQNEVNSYLATVTSNESYK